MIEKLSKEQFKDVFDMAISTDANYIAVLERKMGREKPRLSIIHKQDFEYELQRYLDVWETRPTETLGAYYSFDWDEIECTFDLKNM